MYATPTMPGLFGSSNWLQVDISRLPRPDEIVKNQGMQTTLQGSSGASDVKTVTYYMAGMSGMSPSPAAAGKSAKCLLRREISRATSLAATGSGTSTGVSASPEPLAPEIVNIELQYFNGSVYQSTWDSRQQHELPKAVKIRVSFLADAVEPPDNEVASRVDQRNVVTYETVVAPAAWRPAPAWLSTMQTMNSGSGGNSSTTGGTGAF
jgi:hypothetical protein